MDHERIDLMEAARRLEITYHAALNLVLRGVLTGERVKGHWQVDASSVAAYPKRGHPTATRRDR